jgi:corrinoid protein of di/trimethylamine methyltransferase
MASAERTKEILKGLHAAVVAFDEAKVVELCHTALDEGVDPYVATMDGLADGMQEVGDLYNKKEYFVPELLMCADALYAGLDILRPAIIASGRKSKVVGTVVIGVVEGDVHDIGKNLIKMMFDVAGWTVYDLGRDVPLENFVKEQLRTDSEIVAMSAMMTTSMLGMPKVIKLIREKNPKCRIMIGGAPINPDIAKRFDADGYADGAGTAVDEAMRLIAMLREEEAAASKK